MSCDGEIRLLGAPVSEGIAIGMPFFFAVTEETFPEFSIVHENIEEEIQRYRRALFLGCPRPRPI